MSKDVFVIHEPGDTAVADKLSELLEARGITCWSDHSTRTMAAPLEEEAALVRLQLCDVILLLLSTPEAVSSRIERELAHAVRHHIPILLLRLSDVPTPTNLELYLKDCEQFDLFSTPLDSQIDWLLDKVFKALRSKVTEATEVPPPRARWRDGGGNFVSYKEGAAAEQMQSSDRVTFAAFAPTIIAPRQSFVLDIWAHTVEQSQSVSEQASVLGRGNRIGTKSGISVTSDTILGVVLEIPTMRIADPTDNIVWRGEPSNASFIVEVPPDAAYRTHPGRAVITASGIPITKVIFSLTVSGQPPSSNPAPMPTSEHRPRTAFASYSSRDRAEVLARVQGMHKVQPELDVFVDVITLRAGQRWEEEIGRRVRTDEVFFLFWSEHAAASKEVEKEWRLALAARGINYIDPVPLSDPAEVTPPHELRELHFNDYYLAHIKLSQQRLRDDKRRKRWWRIW